MAGLYYVLAHQAALVGFQFGGTAPENLTAHHPGIAVPVHLFKYVAHYYLAFAVGIYFGIIKKVNAGFVGLYH